MEDKTGSYRSCRWNVIDLLLILCLLAAVCFAVLVLDPFGLGILGSEQAPVTIQYTVCFEDIDGYYVGKIHEGDPAFDADTKQKLGQVVAVTAEPRSVLQYGEQGVEMKEVPDVYSVYVTLLTDARYSEGVGYSSSGKRMAVGAGYTLIFPEFSAAGFCTALEEKG